MRHCHLLLWRRSAPSASLWLGTLPKHNLLQPLFAESCRAVHPPICSAVACIFFISRAAESFFAGRGHRVRPASPFSESQRAYCPAGPCVQRVPQRHGVLQSASSESRLLLSSISALPPEARSARPRPLPTPNTYPSSAQCASSPKCLWTARCF